MPERTHKKFHKSTVILIVVLAAVTVLLLMAASVYSADDDAVASVYDNPAVNVEVSDGDYIVRPASGGTGTGIILYPGAGVASDAYLQLAGELAAEGYVCAVPSVPMNMAVMDINAAERIIDRCSDVGKWYIGGHSLGGVAASRFAADNPGRVSGIVFLASYPDTDISAGGMPVLYLYGTEDGVLNMERMYDSVVFCSDDTEMKEIEGGNHAGFGTYGPRAGDGEALISQQEQRRQAASYIKEYMERDGNGNQN